MVYELSSPSSSSSSSSLIIQKGTKINHRWPTIGSNCAGHIRNITFTDMVLGTHANQLGGLFIKTYSGNGGTIEDVTWVRVYPPCPFSHHLRPVPNCLNTRFGYPINKQTILATTYIFLLFDMHIAVCRTNAHKHTHTNTHTHTNVAAIIYATPAADDELEGGGVDSNA